jgi:hypothetical protein
MKTVDFFTSVNSKQLKESFEKQFGSKLNFDKYNREQLEDMRNKLRTKVFQQEGTAGFNDLLTNETYQKDQALLKLLNTRIKEMLGEDIKKLRDRMVELSEAKKGVKSPKYKIHSQGTSAKDYDGDGKIESPKDEVWGSRAKAAKKAGKPFEESAKPDFLDMDKDGNKKEPMKKAAKDAKVKETRISELSNDTLKSYSAKAKKDSEEHKKAGYAYDSDPDERDFAPTMFKKAASRAAGAAKADSKMKEGFPTVADAKARAEKEKTTGKFDKKEIKPGVTQYTRKSSTFDNGTEEKPKAKKVKEAFPTVADAKARAEKEKTTGKFDVKKTSTGTQYTRKASTFTDGGDDSDTKKAKKAAKLKEANIAFKQNVVIVNENLRRMINEDEEGKAKAITAASDMVNDFTSWMQRVGQYQTKAIIELADAIRADFGASEAEQFKQSVAPALAATLETLTQQREAISNAVAVLAGETTPEEPMGMEPDMGGEMEPGMEPTEPDMMNEPEMGDEFGAAEGPGTSREVRESKFARKLAESHSIMSRLAK